MTSEEIVNIILDEINGNFEIPNPHAVDLKESLITPVKQEYLSVIDKSIKLDLWTVLEETKEGDGYKIFFDEDDNTFGLGMKSETDELLYLGNYGTFLETLKAM